MVVKRRFVIQYLEKVSKADGLGLSETLMCSGLIVIGQRSWPASEVSGGGPSVMMANDNRSFSPGVLQRDHRHAMGMVRSGSDRNSSTTFLLSGSVTPSKRVMFIRIRS